MYEYLTGQLIEKSPTSVVLDVQGTGYQITIPLSTYEKLPAVNQSVRLLIHFVVREDAHTLFGFASDEERRIFRLLVSVSGIGPRMAITALSGITIPELKRAIVQGSLHILQGIPGIGKKTAERIVVELREKLVLEGQTGARSDALSTDGQETLMEDCLQALIALGYRKQSAQSAIQKALKSDDSSNSSVEGLIRASLKYV